MGFTNAPPIALKYLGPVKPGRPPRFELLEDLVWEHEGQPTITVPTGTTTDFASVPTFLWGLIASYGKQTLPAILHDFDSGRAHTFERRREADERFRLALIDEGVPRLRATVMWAAVGLATFRTLDKKRAPRFITQLAFGVLALLGAVAGPWMLWCLWPWSFLLILLAPLPYLLAGIWGPEARYLRISTSVFALFSGVLLTALINAGVYWLISGAAWLLSGRKGPPPDFQSTVKLDLG